MRQRDPKEEPITKGKRGEVPGTLRVLYGSDENGSVAVM